MLMMSFYNIIQNAACVQNLSVNKYHEGVVGEIDDYTVDLRKQILEHQNEEIVEILYERVVRRTRSQNTNEYLVHWKDKVLEDAMWIPNAELK